MQKSAQEALKCISTSSPISLPIILCPHLPSPPQHILPLHPSSISSIPPATRTCNHPAQTAEDMHTCGMLMKRSLCREGQEALPCTIHLYSHTMDGASFVHSYRVKGTRAGEITPQSKPHSARPWRTWPPRGRARAEKSLLTMAITMAL